MDLHEKQVAIEMLVQAANAGLMTREAAIQKIREIQHDTGIHDYVLTDGHHEREFVGEKAFERAVAAREAAGSVGRIWRRTYCELGFIDGVTDVTPKSLREMD